LAFIRRLRPLAAAFAVAGLVLASSTSSGQVPAPQGPAASAEAKALLLLLEGAATLAPGTYTVAGTAIEPSKDTLPVLVQADALRGPEKTVQAVLSLGAQATQPALTRARVWTAGGAAPTLVFDVSGSSPAGAIRNVSKLTLRPGEYDLQAVVAQPGTGGKVLAALARSRLVIPDFFGAGLAVSPLVLGDEVAAAPASSAGSPFVFGPTALRPSAGDRFAQSGQLHLAFRVHNWTAPAQEKPDLQVEYVFYEQKAGRSRFFNKLKPQLLNAKTLGERFDSTSAAVSGGSSIPLASFPFGTFQVTVRVTDQRTKQTASQEARFVVVP
ncbi:MAG TPA: hypothetical protein VI589_01040, partial [Vicinamibacteria bacterium]